MASTIRVTLYDYDPKTGQPKPPITKILEYDPNMSLEEQGFKKLAITAGDEVGCGTVVLPLAALTTLMQAVMNDDMERQSNIILPTPPGIILPN